MNIWNIIKGAMSMGNPSQGSMVIAVTSQNYRTVTKHAGLCRKLLVYRVQRDKDCKSIKSINEIERISLPKENALYMCKLGIEHPIDVASVLVCGSCGEGFLKKMGQRGIAVSVATSGDPIEAIKEFLANGARHYTCDGPHQKVIKRHKNCPHNKEPES